MRGIESHESVSGSPYPSDYARSYSDLHSTLNTLSLLFPLLLIVAMFIGHRRYRAYQLHQQIEWLERLWQISSHEHPSR